MSAWLAQAELPEQRAAADRPVRLRATLIRHNVRRFMLPARSSAQPKTASSGASANRRRAVASVAAMAGSPVQAARAAAVELAAAELAAVELAAVELAAVELAAVEPGAMVAPQVKQHCPFARPATSAARTSAYCRRADQARRASNAASKPSAAPPMFAPVFRTKAPVSRTRPAAPDIALATTGSGKPDPPWAEGAWHSPAGR